MQWSTPIAPRGKTSILFSIIVYLACSRTVTVALCLTQVSELWRTSYKLTKEFAHPEFRGPLRVASTVKARLENFKINMPLINALCTPGIKDRHWEAMSVKVQNKTNRVFI